MSGLFKYQWVIHHPFRSHPNESHLFMEGKRALYESLLHFQEQLIKVEKAEAPMLVWRFGLELHMDEARVQDNMGPLWAAQAYPLHVVACICTNQERAVVMVMIGQHVGGCSIAFGAPQTYLSHFAGVSLRRAWGGAGRAEKWWIRFYMCNYCWIHPPSPDTPSGSSPNMPILHPTQNPPAPPIYQQEQSLLERLQQWLSSGSAVYNSGLTFMLQYFAMLGCWFWQHKSPVRFLIGPFLMEP